MPVIELRPGARNGAGDSGTEPPDNGAMEARIAKLEAGVSHLEREVAEVKQILRGHDAKFDGQRDRTERDFRLTFGALIAVALGLAGLMAKGFHWL